MECTKEKRGTKIEAEKERKQADRQALVEGLKFTLVLRLSIMFSLSKDLCFL